MNTPLFSQSVIAFVWDFDKTLIPNYMQQPLFDHYGVDGSRFWEEVNSLEKEYKRRGIDLVSKDSLYLNHILTYVRHNVFPDLSNTLLLSLGKKLSFFPGLPDFFRTLRSAVEENEEFQKYEIKVEHYIVSTGLRRMILGSAIAPFVDGVWGCEFIEGVPKPGFLDEATENSSDQEQTITDVAYSIDNTSKTRAVFEINKGTNKLPDINVNSAIAEEERRVPFKNMVYIADGPSDVPVFSVVKRYGGKTFAVYSARSQEGFRQANQLQKQDRVQFFGEADYQPGTQTHLWLLHAALEIARRIAGEKEHMVQQRAGRPPEHLIE